MMEQNVNVERGEVVKGNGEYYYPSANAVAQTNVKDWSVMAEEALKHPEAFWEARAEELGWYQKWHTVLDDTNKPFYQWFVGGKTNIVHNAIDRHLHTYRKNKLAIVMEKAQRRPPSAHRPNRF